MSDPYPHKNILFYRIDVNSILTWCPEYDKEEDKMKARFKITTYIYHNYKKIAEMATTRDISDSKDSFAKQKNILLTIPYTPPAKGKYYFDIIVKDEGTTSGPPYRDILEYKL